MEQLSVLIITDNFANLPVANIDADVIKDQWMIGYLTEWDVTFSHLIDSGNFSERPVALSIRANDLLALTRTSPYSASVTTFSTDKDEFPTCTVRERRIMGNIILALWWK